MEHKGIKELIIQAKESNATTLDLSSKGLSSLPPEISELKNLTELNISYNQLSSLPPEISKLNNLSKLSIYKNQLTSLPPEISELKNLTELNISDNQLTSLPPEIAELKNLTKLKISFNQLTSLPPEIAELKNLTELNISDNQLTSLPPEIAELKNLTKLKISFNQLTSLPPEIAELKNLTELFLDGNPLENLPLEIMEKGIEEIRNYFKSFEEEKRPLNEVKVLLVGEGSSGKTSLVKRLLGEGFDGNEHQTQGINIKGWKFKYKDKEIKVNFWDFGGQEIMHSTHQFFLSKRSLYILVLDGRKDEKPEYWLKLIENFGGDSPVLVVINKIDENPAFELNRKFLHEKYPSIKGFYRLSCKSNEGVEEFSKALQEELTKVKHLETTWPKSWFNVKSRIEKICPSCPSNIEDKNACEYFNFIDYKEYKQMCENEGIKDESKQNTLVDFLHDLGVIIHFRDIPLLNTHVLEPEWVTNAVYKIVNSKDIVESRGVLKLNMLPEILKQRNEGDFYYPPDQYGFIISLMKKFELSYDLDDHTMLLPSLLEIQEPNFEFEYEGVLRFIIDYDFLPPIVMPRFIVKMSKDIKDDLRWRTGVILEDKNLNSSAVVRADNEAKRISIYVNGKQRRDYFAIILKKFREINNSFEKLKATEKIPLPDKPDVTVSYKHLIKLELRGFEEYMPDGSDKEYRVSDLLGTVINRNSERALLEEVHQMMELSLSNEKEILEVLSFLKENATESDTEETLIEKLNKYFEIRPQIIPGVQLNVNEIVKLFLKWRKGKF
ncbi:MAG: COR domain-containing protein [Methanosarcina sp.]|nr:COR domain-containing protein [Methanosarcina sp.]